MRLTLRMALRNLAEHRRKTLIIGIIVALGVVVLVVGNSLMDTATAGIERSFINNYTGQVFISAEAEGNVSVFGVQSVGGIGETPTLPAFDKVYNHVVAQDEVIAATPQVTGYSLVRLEGEEYGILQDSVPTLLFGIDPESYREMFSSVEMVEGRYLQPGEEGLMLSRQRIDELEAQAEEVLERNGTPRDVDINPGDEIRVLRIATPRSRGFSKIRVVPLVGIYEPMSKTEGVGTEFICYIDINTQRALQGMTIGYDGSFDVDEGTMELLDEGSNDEAFTTDDFFVGDDFFAAPEAGESSATSGGVEDPFAGLSIRPTEPNLDSGAWHFILANLQDGRRVDRFVRELNGWFDEEGLAIEAGNWEQAAGPFATAADTIRTVYNVAVVVIGVVAIIIIMNTLVIAVTERTGEIGTMRALGAQRGFVRRLFATELLSIVVIFGVIGAALGSAIVGVISLAGIPATNNLLEVLFAGPELRPDLSVTSLFTSLAVVGAAGLLSLAYPVSLALKIQPVDAMRTE